MRIEVKFIAEDGDSPQDELFAGNVMKAEKLVSWSLQTPRDAGGQHLQLYATGEVAWVVKK